MSAVFFVFPGVLASPKKTSAYGGEPKTPRIWAFLAKPFRKKQGI
jgi:hypothetical protein